jgi:hypothetical protein
MNVQASVGAVIATLDLAAAWGLGRGAPAPFRAWRGPSLRAAAHFRRERREQRHTRSTMAPRSWVVDDDGIGDTEVIGILLRAALVALECARDGTALDARSLADPLVRSRATCNSAGGRVSPSHTIATKTRRGEVGPWLIGGALAVGGVVGAVLLTSEKAPDGRSAAGTRPRTARRSASPTRATSIENAG